MFAPLSIFLVGYPFENLSIKLPMASANNLKEDHEIPFTQAFNDDLSPIVSCSGSSCSSLRDMEETLFDMEYLTCKSKPTVMFHIKSNGRRYTLVSGIFGRGIESIKGKDVVDDWRELYKMQRAPKRAPMDDTRVVIAAPDDMSLEKVYTAKMFWEFLDGINYCMNK